MQEVLSIYIEKKTTLNIKVMHHPFDYSECQNFFKLDFSDFHCKLDAD